MNTKTVKEKVEEIINDNTIVQTVITINDHIEQESSFASLRNIKVIVDKIDKLYRKEHNLIISSILKDKFENTRGSYTCCNIEVSEPKGSEVMCPECKEWVTTK